MICSFLLLEDICFGSPLSLAHEDLQSFSLQDNGVSRSRLDLPSLDRLASLTALTRLELNTGMLSCTEEEIEAVKNLQLRELVLVNCAGIELKLFVPGALSRLRKLHIEDRKCIAIGSGYRARNELMLDKERDKLTATGGIVFQLRELCQISGLCNLFVLGMRRGLRKWDVAALPERPMVSRQTSHRCPLHLMKVWTKARS